MKDYLGVYIRFLIGLGALLILGLLLQSFTSGQSRTPRDETAAELRRQNLNNRWIDSLNKSADARRAKKLAEEEAELEREAERADNTLHFPRTVTIASKLIKGDDSRLREKLHEEGEKLTKLIGGRVGLQALRRNADDSWEITYEWEP